MTLLQPIRLTRGSKNTLQDEVGARSVESESVNAEDEVQPKWDKVLWRKQPFPDNYVPPTFLSELRDIPPRPRPRFSTLFIAAFPVSQHIAVIALFLAVFHNLLSGNIGAGQVGWACVIVGSSGHWVHKWGWAGQSPNASAPFLPPPTPLRHLLLPPLLLSLLSPVLGTLTSATTSDSIWPLAGGLFFVHLLLADFTTGKDLRVRRREMIWRKERKRRMSVSGGGVQVQVEPYIEEKSLSSSLSLTSALSASVVLASRLPSTSHVFSLVLLAVGLFAGWPPIAKNVREAGKVWSISLTFSMISLAISFFPPGDHHPIRILLAVLGLVNVVGPALLWYAWKWKVHRGGEWDVAQVRLRRRRDAG